MGNIFIKKLTIDNFRCFDSECIDFKTPDGKTEGSGLNILIGENGNGKTTVLEALNYLTQSKYSSENRLKVNDFRDYGKGIFVSAETEEFKCKMSLPYRGYFLSNGFEFNVKNRDRKSPGKLLSSPFQISNSFVGVGANYMKENGEDSGKTIPSLYKMFSNKAVDSDEINIFYFDKNRTRQISTGNYKTTFEKICDDLNWKFVKEVNDGGEAEKNAMIDNVCGDYFKHVIDVAQKSTGEKIATDLKEFFDQDDYQNLGIELLDLLHPFSNAFFATRKEGELTQINAKSLGSGVEMILTLLLLKNISGESKGSVIYLIDEPELHLHPKAQENLLKLLLEESKDKQIFLSTHSPYMFRNCLSKDVGFLLFKRDVDNNMQITNANGDGWGVLPWSPSWGEINYYAYDLPTVEFHNELYGHLQEISEKETIIGFDTYLKADKGVVELKDYLRGSRSNEITLCTYVRNQIHHPENTDNVKFTDVELQKSIEILLSLF